MPAHEVFDEPSDLLSGLRPQVSKLRRVAVSAFVGFPSASEASQLRWSIEGVRCKFNYVSRLCAGIIC